MAEFTKGRVNVPDPSPDDDNSLSISEMSTLDWSPSLSANNKPQEPAKGRLGIDFAFEGAVKIRVSSRAVVVISVVVLAVAIAYILKICPWLPK